jgi:hypothetical protein
MKTIQTSFVKHQETASKRGVNLKSTFHTNTSDMKTQELNFVRMFFDRKFELKQTGDNGLR